MEAKLYGQNKGGMSINGIIKDYYAYAGENISAGDLVEYVNGVAGKTDYGESVDTQLSTETYTGETISAVALDENRVFVAHSYGSNRKLYGIVVTINGSTIIKGVDTQLRSDNYSARGLSTVLLDGNRVFISHNYGSGWGNSLGAMVVTIDGDAIMVGENTQLNINSTTGEKTYSVKLDENKVFVTHCYGSNYYLYGMICTIDGTTITAGSDTALVSSTNAGSIISTCLLPNGNVFIAHSYGSNYYLYGIVCSIDGTTITKGSDTAISTSSNNTGYRISAVKLDDNKVLILYAHTDGSSYLYGIVCAISSATITKGTETLITNDVRAAYTISGVQLDDNRVLVVHSNSNSMYLYGVVCAILDMTITPGVDTIMNDSEIYVSQAISPLLLPNKTIFVAHSYTSANYYLYAQIFAIENDIPTNNITVAEYETQIRNTTTGQFDGIAKTSGEGSPEFVEGEVKKTGNIFPTNWNEEIAGTKYSSNEGYTLTTNGTNLSPTKKLSELCDEDISTIWQPLKQENNWVKMDCPKPTKITKMKTYFGGTYFLSANIKGSKDNSEWVSLYTISSSQSTLTEIKLENPDYYKYYQIDIVHSDSSQTVNMREWQTSEYIEKGLVPSTGHKDIVSIWTMPQEVVYEGNIFPTSGWNEEVSKLKYSTDSGYIIEADSVADIGTDDFHSYRACDNSLDSYYYSGNAQEQRLTITLPKPAKITKMKTSIYVASTDANNVSVKGSKDGDVWVDLGKPALVTSLASTPPLTEFTLDNPDYYTYYRIYGNLNSGNNSIQVYEWQTTEYIILE